MAYIDYISHDDASDELKELYNKYGEPDGTIDNIVRIAGPNPKALEFHLKFYRAVLHGKSPLSRQQRELIAIVVSSINHCHY